MTPEAPDSDARPNIFLVGPMGVGKSTIGRHVAKRTRRAFIDTDREIEERTGVDIATIFDIEGEAGFRERECAMLAEATQGPGVVVATGGGAIENPANRTLLAERGFVVYLTARPKDLIRRLRHDTRRPLLQTKDPAAAITAIFERRDPLYREVANLVVSTGNRSIKAVTEEVLSQCPP